jgi:hypothetical protein
VITQRATRRRFLLAAIGATSARPRIALARLEGDGASIAKLLAVERLLMFSYRRVLASGAIRGAAARLGRTALAHEIEHERALLRASGASAPPAPSLASAEQAVAALHVSASLTRLRTEHDCLRLLVDLEEVAEGAYYDAMSKLGSPELLVLAAEIMASEAQHAAALGELLHRGDVTRAVPDAFVQGKT